jgi:hypothetical protein
MTLEEIAVAAMQGLLANETYDDEGEAETLALDAFVIAKAMKREDHRQLAKWRSEN